MRNFWSAVDIEQVRYDTDDVAPRERFDYWRDGVMAPFFRADIAPHEQPRDGDGRAPFAAALRLASFSDVVFAQFAADAFTVARGADRIRAETSEAAGLCLFQDDVVIRFCGAEQRCAAGQPWLACSSEPFSYRVLPRAARAPSFNATFFVLPRARLDAASGRVAPLPLLAPRAPAGALLASFLQLVGDRAPELGSLDADVVATVIAQLVGAAFAGANPAVDDLRASARVARRAQVTAWMRAHLEDPDLDPARIARASRLSVRALHALFADAPESVCALLLQLRLQRAHALLREGDPAHGIGAVAFACGFNDAAHFSRSFKRRYGYTARELRAAPRP